MKKKILPIIIATFILIIIVAGVVISSINHSSSREIAKISYTYGGGFGTVIDTANRTITFTPNGGVKLSNNYNSYEDAFSIDQNKYNELNDFIVARLSLFDEDPVEDLDVLDGSYSSIKIDLKSGQSKEIGGYMLKNGKFAEIREKIFETVDPERLNIYQESMEKVITE